MAEMRGELERLKRDASAKTEPQIVPISATVAEPSSPASQAAKQETKPAPKVTGIDLGPVRATPYGTIYFNAFGNSGGTNNADVPLFATPTNQGNVSMSVRQTRLGLKLEGPTIAHAKSRGQIEADFFGGFPAVGVGENFGVVRLRLAFVQLDWGKTSLEVGQDWIVFAPNNPVSIAAAAIPQMAAAGESLGASAADSCGEALGQRKDSLARRRTRSEYRRLANCDHVAFPAATDDGRRLACSVLSKSHRFQRWKLVRH